MIKNALWAGWSAISIATLSLTSVNITNHINYHKNMKNYKKWREEFFKEKLGGDDMCNQKEECLSKDNKIDKQYLPYPYEDDLWEKLYESLKKNNEYIRRKQEKTTNEKEQLIHIETFYKLKDYCYEEIKVAIEKGKLKEKSDKEYFNVRGNAGNIYGSGESEKSHERCVLTKEQLFP